RNPTKSALRTLYRKRAAERSCGGCCETWHRVKQLSVILRRSKICRCWQNSEKERSSHKKAQRAQNDETENWIHRPWHHGQADGEKLDQGGLRAGRPQSKPCESR